MSLFRNLFRDRSRLGPEAASGQFDGRFEALTQQIAKLGREQLQANTLLEAQSESLDELSRAWHEHLDQREQQADEARRALSELEGQIRLSLAKDLLPIADALAESIRSARELAERGPEPGGQERRSGGWTFGLRRWRPAHAPLPPLPAVEAWLQGLALVERRLLALLERAGVRPIAALGQAFDPERHLAVAAEPPPAGSDVLDGTVIGEMLRGYIAGNRVLRYAEVVVARRASGDRADDEGVTDE